MSGTGYCEYCHHGIELHTLGVCAVLACFCPPLRRYSVPPELQGRVIPVHGGKVTPQKTEVITNPEPDLK